MKYGLSFFPTDFTIRLDEQACAAETHGFDSLLVAEHPHIPTSRLTVPATGMRDLPPQYSHTLDPFVALARAASSNKTLGPISGCHINPAVTFGVAAHGKFEAKHFPGYVIAQIAGAIIAGGVLLTIAQRTSAGYDLSTAGFAANGYGAHSPGGYNLTAAFVAEVVFTFFLVFTVLGATDIKAPVGFAGIPIGIVRVLVRLVGIPVTNRTALFEERQLRVR